MSTFQTCGVGCGLQVVVLRLRVCRNREPGLVLDPGIAASVDRSPLMR